MADDSAEREIHLLADFRLDGARLEGGGIEGERGGDDGGDGGSEDAEDDGLELHFGFNLGVDYVITEFDLEVVLCFGEGDSR